MAACCLRFGVSECMLPDETALSCHVQAGLRDPTLQSRHLGRLLSTVHPVQELCSRLNRVNNHDYFRVHHRFPGE